MRYGAGKASQMSMVSWHGLAIKRGATHSAPILCVAGSTPVSIPLMQGDYDDRPVDDDQPADEDDDPEELDLAAVLARLLEVECRNDKFTPAFIFHPVTHQIELVCVRNGKWEATASPL